MTEWITIENKLIKILNEVEDEDEAFSEHISIYT